MKKWLFLILLFPLICVAQTYRYLGVEDGLSNRRVYCIQKDKTGYMWFLTHEGIDRYNGKEFKRYKLMDGDAEVNSLLNLNWLYIDQEGVLWEIGKKGKVFRYDQIQLHPQDGACQASYTETDAKGDIQVPCLFIVHRAKGA